MSGGSFQSWVIGTAVIAACAVLITGLIRTGAGRFRHKIVIPDIEPNSGAPPEATIGLVAQLRETVRRDLRRQASDAYQAESRVLDADINAGLMPISGRLPMTALTTDVTLAIRKVVTRITRMANDAVSELSMGLRTVASAEVQGLLSALGGILPAQRGWNIRVHPVIRGTGSSAEAGLSLELSQSGGVPDEVTTFWMTSPALQDPAGDAAQVAAVRELLHELLRPASAWIAIRLVSRHLTQARGVVRRTVRLVFRRHDQRLTGLQLLLAGQMSLYATRLHEKSILGFARQALEDLEQAEELLPGYFRPLMTQGFVYERRGWACLHTGDTAAATRAFHHGIRAYDQAEKALLAVCGPGVDARRRDSEIEAIVVRRAKCRILSGDYLEAQIARDELEKGLPLRYTGSVPLYNAACAFAVAMGSPHLPDEDRAFCERHAWDHLGQALLAGGQNDKTWSRMVNDEELSALEPSRRAAFATEIRRLHSTAAPLPGNEAQPLVAKAMATLGLPRLLAEGAAPVPAAVEVIPRTGAGDAPRQPRLGLPPPP
jgi:hypothetical protein